MKHFTLPILFLFVVVLLTGCGKSDPPLRTNTSSSIDTTSSNTSARDAAGDVDVSKHTAVAASDQPPETPGEPDVAAASAPDTGDAATDPDQDQAEREDSATADVDENQLADAGDVTAEAGARENELPPNPPERLLLLTSQGPLIVDLAMWIDGQPFRQLMDQMIDDVIRLGDQDDDGRTTWEELTNSPHFVYGQFGNVMINTERQRQDIERNYDINQNQRVDPNEVPGFLSQNAGSSKIFSLQSTNSEDSASSAAFRWLDVDSDGRLSADEGKSAAVRLCLLDANDDDILVAGELNQDPPADMRQQRRRRRYAKETAVLLDDYADLSSLLFLLEERYALGSPLTPDDFQLPGDLFGQLDADGDEEVDIDEIKRMKTIKPHVAMSIGFGDETDQTPAEIIVSELHEAIEPSTQQTTLPNSVTLTLQQFEVSVARDERGPTGQAEALSSAWKQADGDENDYLDESEFAQLQPLFNVPFAAVDSNEDGQLLMPEAKDFLERRESAGRSRLQANAGVQTDPLFSYLDRDNNHQLTTRELRSVSQMIAKLDANQDGHVDNHELPLAMSVRISRGLAAGQVAPDQGLTTTDRRDGQPDWFFNMDTNRDGELSQKEFLGTTPVFDQLDRNQDGFIEAKESTNELSTDEDEASRIDEN